MMVQEQHIPINIFYAHADAREDEYLRGRLEKHLAPLQQQGGFTGWHPQLVSPGEDVAATLAHHINQAHLILFLVSADFLASTACIQMTQWAIERFQAGKVHVIPILLRPADYRSTLFAHLSPLPTDSRPITSWPDPERALQMLQKDSAK